MSSEWVARQAWPDNIAGFDRALRQTYFVGQVGDCWSPASPVLFFEEHFCFLVEVYREDCDLTACFLLRYNPGAQHTSAELIQPGLFEWKFSGNFVPWALLHDGRMVILNHVF